MVEAQVLKTGLCYLQVCVPSRWTDAEVELFANMAAPTGIASRWKVTNYKHPDGTEAKRYVGCESQPKRAKHVVLVC